MGFDNSPVGRVPYKHSILIDCPKHGTHTVFEGQKIKCLECGWQPMILWNGDGWTWAEKAKFLGPIALSEVWRFFKKCSVYNCNFKAISCVSQKAADRNMKKHMRTVHQGIVLVKLKETELEQNESWCLKNLKV